MTETLSLWRAPMLAGPELHDVPAPLARRLEALLSAAPLPADGGDPHHRRRTEQQVTTLAAIFRQRQRVDQVAALHTRADDGLLPASAERHGELARTLAYLQGQLDLDVAWAVLHDDLGQCAPADVALAAGVGVQHVDDLVAAQADYGETP